MYRSDLLLHRFGANWFQWRFLVRNSLSAISRRIIILAKTFAIILAAALFASPVTAEPIRVAYSGVAATGTPLWLTKDEGIFSKHGEGIFVLVSVKT
jgi:hypothetical protein